MPEQDIPLLLTAVWEPDVVLLGKPFDTGVFLRCMTASRKDMKGRGHVQLTNREDRFDLRDEFHRLAHIDPDNLIENDFSLVARLRSCWGCRDEKIDENRRLLYRIFLTRPKPMQIDTDAALVEPTSQEDVQVLTIEPASQQASCAAEAGTQAQSSDYDEPALGVCLRRPLEADFQRKIFSEHKRWWRHMLEMDRTTDDEMDGDYQLLSALSLPLLSGGQPEDVTPESTRDFYVNLARCSIAIAGIQAPKVIDLGQKVVRFFKQCWGPSLDSLHRKAGFVDWDEAMPVIATVRTSLEQLESELKTAQLTQD